MTDALGYVTWFSIPNDPVKLSVLRKAWIDAKLDPASIPAEQRTADIFRRALREQEHTVRSGTPGSPVTIATVEVKEVLQSNDELVYQISRIVRDTDPRLIDHKALLRVSFAKADGQLKCDQFTSGTTIANMVAAIQAYMVTHSKTISGDRVREIVRNYITHNLAGVNLRGNGGGVYFYLARHGQQAGWLTRAIDSLYPDHSAYLIGVPLANDSAGRHLIRRHYISSTTKDIESAIVTADKILRGDRQVAIRSDVAAFHHLQLLAFADRIAQYDHILGEGGDTKAMLELLRTLKSKVDKIRAGGV